MNQHDTSQWIDCPCGRAYERRPANAIIITREEFRQAFGAAFCEPGNTHKEMDSTLGLAVEKMLFDGIRPEGTHER